MSSGTWRMRNSQTGFALLIFMETQERKSRLALQFAGLVNDQAKARLIHH